MKLTPLQLRASWRDDVACAEPHSMRRYSAVFDSKCWVTRFYHAPENQFDVLAAEATIEHQMSIPQGSVIYGIHHQPEPGNTLPFRFQLIDTSLNHDVFNGFVPDCYVFGAPWLFPVPYPVVGTGQFTVRLFNPSTSDAVRATLIFGVAELRRVNL
jgi:hypothetical protein